MFHAFLVKGIVLLHIDVHMSKCTESFLNISSDSNNIWGHLRLSQFIQMLILRQSGNEQAVHSLLVRFLLSWYRHRLACRVDVAGSSFIFIDLFVCNILT